MTILRAESLVNDGTALVIFGIAVQIATGHDGVGPGGIALDFLISYAGGIGVGLAAGWLSIRLRGVVRDTLLNNTVSLLTPFAAFLLAEEINASGVLAVVVAGLYISQAGSLLIAAQERIRVRAFWQLATFLLNGTLFVLVGLELRGAVNDLTSYPLRTAVVDALLVAAAVIGTRLVWLNTTPYLIRALDRRPQQRARRIGFRGRQPNAWAGFRGAVSLAAALAIPSGVPGRDLIIVVTFGVILVTLVVQGLTLPAVLRWARLPTDNSETEMAYAESRAVEAALQLLPGEAERLAVDPEITALVRSEVEERRTELTEAEPAPDGLNRREQYRALRLALISEKRRVVVHLRDERRIDDLVLRRFETVLDAEELRLGADTADAGE
ncbi:Na+/H+ antiporter [Winogradskya humida]|uniref:Cation/H+ exchanger transmembrane domain-containing protein n=1 Tax=Winogradskya humida TaxID=113566 RepID=A0ABQ4A5U8_9ACTN|nr:Na+/H+ antiporter [Actinoplanes humidus]GIE25732.1 hypothetical protein Ahu01nite_088340 [Actinoplanes humidus]